MRGIRKQEDILNGKKKKEAPPCKKKQRPKSFSTIMVLCILRGLVQCLGLSFFKLLSIISIKLGMANSNVSFEQACELVCLTEKEIAVISEYMALHSS